MAPLGTAGCDGDAVQLITRTIAQSIGKIAKPSLRSAARDCAEADEDIKNLLDRWPEPEHFQLLISETASLSEEQISLATAYAACQIYETAATALYLAIMDKMAKVVTGEAPPQNRVRFPEKSHWCASRYFGCLEAVRPGFAPVPGRDAGLWPGSGSRAPVGARWRRDAGPRGEARPIVCRSFLKVRCFHSPFGQPCCAGGTVWGNSGLGCWVGGGGLQWGRAPMDVVAQGAVAAGVLGALGTGLCFHRLAVARAARLARLRWPEVSWGCAVSTAARLARLGLGPGAAGPRRPLSGGLGGPLAGVFRFSK